MFGEVERGMDVVDELSKVPVDGNRPRVQLEVRKAIVVPSVAQLAELSLVKAHTVDMSEATAPVSAGAVSPALAAGLALIVGFGVVSFALANRLPARVLMSLVMINVLIGSFLLLVLLTPVAQTSSLLAMGVFAGLLGTFKMMSRFENAT